MDDRCVSPLAYDNRPIGVFDSGLGGLTVARSIATSLSHESIYYVGDTKRCPYGPRSENEVRTFALQAGRWLEAHDVKIIVIACNTADRGGAHRGAADARRSRDRRDCSGRAGCYQHDAHAEGGRARHGAHGAVGRIHTSHPKSRCGRGCIRVPAPSFVNIVERELATGAHLQERWLEDGDIFDTPEIRFEVARTLSPIADTEVDTVVLGCTHFPLLAGPIRHALGTGVRVVSSAEETTRELKDILHRRGQLAAADVEPQHRFATTSDNIAEFAAAGSFIFGQPLKSIVHVDLGELEEMYRR